MRHRRIIPWALLAGSVVVGSFSSSVRAGSVTYVVNIDSTSIAGTTGYLDFQFNPASSSSTAASAAVTGFSTDATPLGSLGNIGNATGSLPGDLAFDNGTPTNEVTEQYTFGNNFTFDVTLSGPAVGSTGPDSSTFFVTLFDGGFNPYSQGPGGAIGTIDINPDGSTTAMTFAPVSMPGPTATITSMSPVPEPGSLALVAIGAGFVVAISRRHRLSRGRYPHARAS